MRNLARLGGLIAVMGGVSWLVKVTLVFMRAPDLLIGVFYFAGLLGPVGAAIGLSDVVLKTRTLAVRLMAAIVQIIAGVIFALLFVFLTFAVQDLLEIPFRGSFSEFVLAEIPILIEGIIWGIVGVVIRRREAGRP